MCVYHRVNQDPISAIAFITWIEFCLAFWIKQSTRSNQWTCMAEWENSIDCNRGQVRLMFDSKFLVIRVPCSIHSIKIWPKPLEPKVHNTTDKCDPRLHKSYKRRHFRNNLRNKSLFLGYKNLSFLTGKGRKNFCTKFPQGRPFKSKWRMHGAFRDTGCQWKFRTPTLLVSTGSQKTYFSPHRRI